MTQPRGTTSLAYWDTPQSGAAGPSGQLKTVTGPDTVTCAFEYDGPLLASQTWSGTVAGSVSRVYDMAFRDSLETVTVGGTSSAARRAYDANGLLTPRSAPFS